MLMNEHKEHNSFVAVQLLSHVWLCTPRTVAYQASLFHTISQSLLKLRSIELVMPYTISSSDVPFPSCFQSFPASGYFLMSQVFASDGQSIGDLSSASVLLLNIQDWFLFRINWLDLLAVQGTLKSLLQHHRSKPSSLQCSVFFIVQLSHPYMTKKHSFD